MDQIQDFADDRLLQGCIYCRAAATTRDHVPSRILLDPPFPENLPVVGACEECNLGFSADEEYVVCAIECGMAGTTDPDALRRSRIGKILRRKPALKAKIDAARTMTERGVRFAVDAPRFRNVLLKLARGHAAFELSRQCLGEPTQFWWNVLPALSNEQRETFDSFHVSHLLGEVGCRASQRMAVMELRLRSPAGEESSMPVPAFITDWQDVQDGRYRYLAVDDEGGVLIRIVIGGYLACEVVWEEPDA